MCINKSQPERSHVTKKHSSGAGTGAMLKKTESSGAGAVSFLQVLRSPGCSDGLKYLIFFGARGENDCKF